MDAAAREIAGWPARFHVTVSLRCVTEGLGRASPYNGSPVRSILTSQAPRQQFGVVRHMIARGRAAELGAVREVWPNRADRRRSRRVLRAAAERRGDVAERPPRRNSHALATTRQAHLRACRRDRHVRIGTMNDDQLAVLTATIARAPEWIRQELLSKEKATRARAEEALAAMISGSLQRNNGDTLKR